MDLWTKSLLGATAAAVIGYFSVIYGGCALDAHCHLRKCSNVRNTCGVVYDKPDATPQR